MAGTMSESCTTTRCAAARLSRAVSMCASAAAALRSAERLELSMRARPCWCDKTNSAHMQKGRQHEGAVSR